MRSALPVVLVIALTVYCLVNCVQAAEGDVRTLPRWAWILLVLLFPLVGGIAYLLAGRPLAAAAGSRTDSRVPRGQPPRAPDDDDDFLRGL